MWRFRRDKSGGLTKDDFYNYMIIRPLVPIILEQDLESSEDWHECASEDECYNTGVTNIKDRSSESRDAILFLEMVQSARSVEELKEIVLFTNKRIENNMKVLLSKVEPLHCQFTTQKQMKHMALFEPKMKKGRITGSCKVDLQAPLNVVGDIHGNLEVLESIIAICGNMNEMKRTGLGGTYLFLGDYVDRGSNSYEVIALLYCLKFKFPHLIHMLRGNHEDAQTCYFYGFFDELNKKNLSGLFNPFCKSFMYMPIVARVKTDTGDLICSHGGFPLRVSKKFDDMKIRAPKASKQIIEWLWNDPQENEGMKDSPRGAGFMYGPDVLSKFLDTIGCCRLLRAHQQCQDGFNIQGDVITIFSCPNYCKDGNRGAVLKIPKSGETGMFILFD
jgi:hypothetical protein